jgi:cytochrome c-type biogenesis protein CcmH
MTLFWVLAAALTAAALLLLLPPLLRKRSAPPDVRGAANAKIYHEQLAELGAELQRGALTQEEFERASREIERRIVAEHARAAGDPGPEVARHRAPVGAAVAVGLLLPLAAALGYWQLGEPRALDADAMQAMRGANPQQLEALVQRLAAQLEKSPQDAEGWSLLGRALSSLGHHGEAAKAFARAVQLSPDNRDLLIEFIQGLALAGRVEFEQRNYAAAIGYWERILPFAPPESEFARSVAESIAEARGLSSASASASAAPPAAGALQGTVSLDPALKGKVKPDAVVFILARPAETKAGAPRMPLAVVRTTVDKLPYRFALDDSMAMAPGVKLSGHAKVVVAARISGSGNAAAQKGDAEGTSPPVAPTATGVKVVISKIVD